MRFLGVSAAKAVTIVVAGVTGLVLAAEAAMRIAPQAEKRAYVQSSAFGTMPAAGQHIAGPDGGFITNDHHMRSGPVPAERSLCEWRILVVGDSVPHGSALGHEALATTMLQRSLAEDYPHPVTVMNASKGGWAPGNVLGYVDLFGTFDADMAIYVANAEDANQMMGEVGDAGRAPQPLDREPVSRLYATLDKKLLSRIKRRLPGKTAYEQLFVPGAGLDEMDRLLARLSEDVPEVGLLYHPRLADMHADPSIPQAMAELTERHGASVTQARYEDGDYTDHIHLNAAGHRAFADHLARAVESLGPPPCAAGTRLAGQAE